MSTAATQNTQREVEITAADLPLHCPRDGEEAWSSHPRVFLPIEDSADGTSLCPYCGTLYRLKR
jgi:uncharacterized Zn-finger protein